MTLKETIKIIHHHIIDYSQHIFLYFIVFIVYNKKSDNDLIKLQSGL